MSWNAGTIREKVFRRKALVETGDKILKEAEREGRPDLDAAERRDFDGIMRKLESLDDEFKQEGLDYNQWLTALTRNAGSGKIIGPQTGAYDSGNEGGHPRIIAPGETRNFAAMFGGGLADDGWQNFRGFVEAVASNRAHPQLRAISEGTPSDGGFLVPPQFASTIFDVALEGEVVRPRASIFPMQSNTLTIPASVIGDHSANLYGGTTAAWGAEGGTLAESQPEFRAMTLAAKKLSIFTVTTSEWLEDSISPETYLQNIFAAALGWYLDLGFLRGSGAGCPLGVLNSPCLVTVAKETGQAADTIVYENLAKMLSRLAPASFSRSVWAAHPTTIPKLLTLCVVIGTSGQYVPVLQESSGQFTMLTRPVVFTEKLEKLGDRGDLVLADFGAYAIGMRSNLRLERSTGPHFQTDKLDWRAITRVDGQPLWDKPLTLADGVTTVSPFVTLAERA
jgi:HK97 family phage major capsid protein